MRPREKVSPERRYGREQSHDDDDVEVEVAVAVDDEAEVNGVVSSLCSGAVRELMSFGRSAARASRARMATMTALERAKSWLPEGYEGA
jgi:hypothetical protein